MLTCIAISRGSFFTFNVLESQNSNQIPSPGEKILVQCRDLDLFGNGISSWHSWIILTPNLIPGERASVAISHKHGPYWFSNLIQIENLSIHRRIPPCSVSEACGGCSIQHIFYDYQIEIKIKHIRDVFGRLFDISLPLDLSCISSGPEFGYRNRTLVPLQFDKDYNLKAGYYKRKTHEIINFEHCLILDSAISALYPHVISLLKEFIRIKLSQGKTPITPKYLGLRVGKNTSEVLLTFVDTSDSKLAYYYEFAHDLKEYIPELKSIYLNIQQQKSNRILGDTNLILAGSQFITEEFCNLNFYVDATSFFQINTKKAETMVNSICSWFQNSHNSITIIDAYCGIGTISLPLAAYGYKVVGLEISKNAIKTAHLNSLLNRLKSVSFVQGDVASNLSLYLNSKCALVLDPPRKGLSRAVIDIILEAKPTKIAYLSCNPSTLARDLTYLCSAYEVKSVIPADFFPNTLHIEALALLQLLHS